MLIFRLNIIVDFHQNGSEGLVLMVWLDHGTIEAAAAGLSTRPTLSVQLCFESVKRHRQFVTTVQMVNRNDSTCSRTA